MKYKSMVLAGAVVIATLGAAHDAAAQSAPAGLDTVLLTNGGRVRGTVMEQDPARGVTVQMSDGTTRQFTAAAVATVQYAGAAPAATPAAAPAAATGWTPVGPAPAAPVGWTQPAPAPAPAPVYGWGQAAPPPAYGWAPGAPPPAYGPPPGMALHIELEHGDHAVLEQRGASYGEGGWHPVCTAPCDAPVQRNVMVRIAGEGVTPSAPIMLDGGVRSLRVSPGSLGAKAAGAGLMITGTSITAITLAIGAFVFPVLAGSIVGLALMIPGLVMMSGNNTRVRSEGGGGYQASRGGRVGATVLEF